MKAAKDPRSQSVSEIRLSTRAYNCLKELGVHTLGQLCDMPSHQVLACRGMGAKTFNELQSALAERGLGFDNSADDLPVQKSSIASISGHIQRLRANERDAHLRLIRAITAANAAGINPAANGPDALWWTEVRRSALAVARLDGMCLSVSEAEEYAFEQCAMLPE